MKKVTLAIVLVIAMLLFISKEDKYSEMENFKKQATTHKMLNDNQLMQKGVFCCLKMVSDTKSTDISF